MCMQKIKIGHRTKCGYRDRFFLQVLFPSYFHFQCVACATFDTSLIHSADLCFLIMACVGYSRAQLKAFSSLLKTNKILVLVISIIFLCVYLTITP